MNIIFISLLNTSITAGYLIIAVLLLRPFLNKAPKYIRCILWGLVGLRLILPFSFESPTSVIPSAQTVPPEIVSAPAPTINSGISILNSSVNPIITESMAPTPEISVNPMEMAVGIAWNVWLIGIIVMCLYSIISFILLKIRLREAIQKDKNVYLCDRVASPFLLGLFAPKIYLPSDLSEEDSVYVIAHENAHIQRKDHWWKPLGFLLLTVYWFHPLMWVAYIFLCRDIEFACDEKVIRQLGSDCKKPYSQALINCSIPRKLISACPVAFGEDSVKSRIKSVLHYKKPAFWIILVALVICIAVAVCFLTDPPKAQEPTETTVPDSNAPVDTLQELPTHTEYKFTARVVKVLAEADCIIVEYQPPLTYSHTAPNPIQIRVNSCPPEIEVGQDVRISYDGYALATSAFPLTLGKIYSIEILNADLPPDKTFCATILEISDHSIKVEPFLCEDELSSVGREIILRVTDSQLEGLIQGDGIQIVYDGNFLASYPPVISEVLSITPLSPSLTALQKEKPHFFGMPTAKGLEIYVWYNGEWRCGLRSVTHREATIQDLSLMAEGVTLKEMSLILSTYPITREEVSILYSYNPAFSGENPTPPSSEEQEVIEETLLSAVPLFITSPYISPEFSLYKSYPLVICGYQMAKGSWRFCVYEDTMLQEAMQDAVWGNNGILAEDVKKIITEKGIPKEEIPVAIVHCLLSSYLYNANKETTKEARLQLGLL